MTQSENTSRRDFLKTGATVAGALAVTPTLSSGLYAAADETLKVGLIGCGGRGTGAANQALNADPNAKLVAMADAFPEHLEKSLSTLRSQNIKDRVVVDGDHQFIGLDAYKDVINTVDVVILTTPPHFRPAQLKAAVDAGKHVFCEKPVAVDATGVRSVMETAKKAKEKGVAIVSGLCYRYDLAKRATMDRIHSGEHGEIVTMQCSYFTQGLWHKGRKPEWSDMEWQLRNWLYFNWLSGDHINEQHIHSLDKMAWAMQDETPIKASGTGGRQTRTDVKWGNVYDHFAIEYEYANGVKGYSRCRQQNGCKNDVTDFIDCTGGRFDIMKHQQRSLAGKPVWRYTGPKKNMYQVEHDELFASIRKGDPINNGDYMAKSTMMAILGRMVAYSGQEITWEQALNCTEDLTPASYEYGALDVKPIAMPGITSYKYDLPK